MLRNLFARALPQAARLSSWRCYHVAEGGRSESALAGMAGWFTFAILVLINVPVVRSYVCADSTENNSLEYATVSQITLRYIVQRNPQSKTILSTTSL